MRAGLRVFSSCILIVLCLYNNAFADAWNQPAGKGIFVSTVSTYHTSHYADRDGNMLAVPAYDKYEGRGYGEYGWNDDWTVGVADAVFYVQQDAARGGSADNVGEAGVDVFLRRALWQAEGMVLAVQPLFHFPAHHADSRNNPPFGAPEEFQSGGELQFGYGFDAFGLHHYITSGAGIKLRHSAAHNVMTLKIAGGFALTPTWELRPEVVYVQPTHMDNDVSQSVSGLNDYAVTKAQLSVAYKLGDDMSLVAGGFIHAWARNTGDGSGALLSLEKRF